MDIKIAENMNNPNLASNSNSTATGQAASGAYISIEKVGEKLQQLKADLLNAGKLLEEHRQQLSNNENWPKRLKIIKLSIDMVIIEGSIKKLKGHQRQLELQKTLNEILQKQNKAAEITKKKRKAAMGILILETDKVYNKRIRMDVSTSTSSNSVGKTNEKADEIQAGQNSPETNKRRQLPPELLNEIYKNLPISNQCRMLTLNISTNALLGGQNAVKKKWLKWKQLFASSISNCHEEIAKSWPALKYQSFVRAFFKRKIQIEWHSYKEGLDENIAWFYQQFKQPSFNKITEMKCCSRRKNRLDKFKRSFAEENEMLDFLAKISSPQFEHNENMKKQLRRIWQGVPEFIRVRKTQFNLVKEEVGNKLELTDILYAKLKDEDQKREWATWKMMNTLRRIGDESERNKRRMNHTSFSNTDADSSEQNYGYGYEY